LKDTDGDGVQVPKPYIGVIMKKEVGSRNSDIWLLGDSNPKNWQKVLKTPLDPRHPARHNIWTPVLEVIQDRVFRMCRCRVDTSQIYVRNAVEDPSKKPPPQNVEWGIWIRNELQEFQKMVREHRPKIIFSFGAFSFEFARRVLSEEPRRSYCYWGTRNLGEQFRKRIGQFNLATTNLLPLLHVSIARGRFIQSHDYFCGLEDSDYFDFTGNHIARKLIECRDGLSVWIE
jgi:hypothetical protein